MKRLLVVIDGNRPSQKAIDYAMTLAAQLSCGLIVAYVIDTELIQKLCQLRVLLVYEHEGLMRDLEERGNAMLKEIRQCCARRQIDVIDTVQCQGRFHAAVLQAARQFSADAIVLGGWEEAAFHRKDAESIERRLVLDQAECPVFILKQD